MRIVTLLLTGLMAVSLAPAAGKVPRPSPELTMQRGGASPITLRQFRGKIVALAFSYTTCDHCQALTVTLKKIQTDYAARNVQVVECAFEEDVKVNYPMFLKAFTPNFATGYTTAVAVKKYLSWDDLVEGMLRIPYMIFIDAGGIIRGDFSGNDGFFGEADKHIRAELDKMTTAAAKQTAQKK
jgi:hypothetical protein